MVQYATFDNLERLGRSTSNHRLLKAAAESKIGKNVFLAHSSLDEELLPVVISILEKEGGRVYIDKTDESLPVKTNQETADTLRKRIRELRRFVVFVTTNSRLSRWIPWELGLADGLKGEFPVALFPALQDPLVHHWPRQEYFGLYQHIVRGSFSGETREQWLVYNRRENTAVPLRQWFTGG